MAEVSLKRLSPVSHAEKAGLEFHLKDWLSSAQCCQAFQEALRTQACSPLPDVLGSEKFRGSRWRIIGNKIVEWNE